MHSSAMQWVASSMAVCERPVTAGLCREHCLKRCSFRLSCLADDSVASVGLLLANLALFLLFSTFLKLAGESKEARVKVHTSHSLRDIIGKPKETRAQARQTKGHRVSKVECATRGKVLRKPPGNCKCLPPRGREVAPKGQSALQNSLANGSTQHQCGEQSNGHSLMVVVRNLDSYPSKVAQSPCETL